MLLPHRLVFDVAMVTLSISSVFSMEAIEPRSFSSDRLIFVFMFTRLSFSIDLPFARLWISSLLILPKQKIGSVFQNPSQLFCHLKTNGVDLNGATNVSIVVALASGLPVT